jgi:pimeloyl-ACP methyl ester carboxylesterase
MKLFVREYGDPSATKTAVLIHGITGSGLAFANIVPELVARGYRVYAPDQLGHGESPKPFGGYAHDNMAALVAAVVPEHIDLLVGHSFGGQIAATGVLNGFLRADVTIMEDPTHHVPSKEYSRKRLRDSEVQPTTVEGLLEYGGYDQQSAESRAFALTALSWGSIAAAFTDPAPWDIRERMSEATLYTDLHYVIPRSSDWVLPESWPIIERQIGAERFHVMDGVGHGIHRDDPEGFLAIIDEAVVRAAADRAAGVRKVVQK